MNSRLMARLVRLERRPRRRVFAAIWICMYDFDEDIEGAACLASGQQVVRASGETVAAMFESLELLTEAGAWLFARYPHFTDAPASSDAR